MGRRSRGLPKLIVNGEPVEQLLSVLMDAQGFRRSVGKQAEILNVILDDIYWGKDLKEDKLKELLGHTPVEVLVGTLIGIFVAIIFKS